MTKKRNHMIPTMQKTHSVQPGKPEFNPPDVNLESVTSTAPIVPNCELVSITIPFVTAPPKTSGHQDEAYRIDMGTLTRERMRKVKALRRGFVASDTRMDGGYEVKTNRDALFCLLDQLDI